MIRYKDFDTQKQHFTRGKFVKWIRGGPLNAWMAVIKRKRSTLFIPDYCLTPESRQSLPRPSDEDAIVTDTAIRAENGRWNLPYDSAFDGRDIIAEQEREHEEYIRQHDEKRAPGL